MFTESESSNSTTERLMEIDDLRADGYEKYAGQHGTSGAMIRMLGDINYLRSFRVVDSTTGVPAEGESQSPELLPCPFDGSAASLRRVKGDVWRIWCPACHVSIGETASLNHLTQWWNTRAISINTTLPAEDGQSTIRIGEIREQQGEHSQAFDNHQELYLADVRKMLNTIEYLLQALDKTTARLMSLESRWDENLAEVKAHAESNVALRTEHDALYSAAVATLKYVNNMNEDAPTYPTCPECTFGSVPNKWNEGLCWIHQLEKAVKEAG